jgi:hypothetical protein
MCRCFRVPGASPTALALRCYWCVELDGVGEELVADVISPLVVTGSERLVDERPGR